MGAEDFSYYLLEKPGCYFLIGNGDGTHRDGGHGMGPCMLHNPSYDFNDDLIPLGGSLWVRLAEAWLAAAAAAMTTATPRRFAQSYAEARDKFLAAARGARPRRRDARPSAARPRRRDARRWTSPATARPTRSRCSSSAAPATASRASAARACRSRCSATPRGTAPRADAGVAVLYVHGLNPYGFSWWRRTTHENVDLNRNFRDFAAEPPANAAYDELAALIVPETWPPDAARPPRRSPRFVAEHGERGAAAGDLGRPVPPSATASSTAAPRRPGATSRCARCCASTARAARGSPGSTCTPASARAATASASSPAATTPTPYARARAWWGDVTSIYDGSLDLGRCSPA